MKCVFFLLITAGVVAAVGCSDPAAVPGKVEFTATRPGTEADIHPDYRSKTGTLPPDALKEKPSGAPGKGGGPPSGPPGGPPGKRP